MHRNGSASLAEVWRQLKSHRRGPNKPHFRPSNPPQPLQVASRRPADPQTPYPSPPRVLLGWQVASVGSETLGKLRIPVRELESCRGGKRGPRFPVAREGELAACGVDERTETLQIVR